VRGWVVLMSGTPFHRTMLADQHIAQRLAEHYDVLYVDGPVSPKGAARDAATFTYPQQPQLVEVAPGLKRLTAVVAPAKDRFVGSWNAARLLRRSIRSAVSQLSGPVKAFIAMTPHHDLFDAVDEGVRIYWAADDFQAAAPLLNVSRRRMTRNERSLTSRADAIITSSPLVQARWTEEGYEPHLIPFGCDYEHFVGAPLVEPAEDIGLDAPVIGFVGHVSPRIDLSLMEAVADAGYSLLLVGPLHRRLPYERIQRLLERSNVNWLGSRPFAELPRYLRAIDVGIVPYSIDDPFNLSSFPLKTPEYLAAGLPVVATALPATHWLNTDLVAVASTPGAFVEAVTAALEAGSPELVAARQAFAAQHSWQARADRVAAVIDRSLSER
jgi:teichuronic acid biosynthesis glycosyltransferase TuaH